jgi:excinuclease ABC subunit C
MQNRPSFDLPVRDSTLFYLQRLRDEAHRFAIGSHRAKRKKTMTESSLDHIEGIGPKRKKALLMHFGSAKAVERAGIDDLLGVEGISESMAEIIYNYFR